MPVEEEQEQEQEPKREQNQKQEEQKQDVESSPLERVLRQLRTEVQKIRKRDGAPSARRLLRLLADLRIKLTGADDEDLKRMQQTCEKILRSTIQAAGADTSACIAANHSRRMLAPATWSSIGDCYALVYRCGVSPTLYDTMAKWEEVLVSKTVADHTRLVHRR